VSDTVIDNHWFQNLEQKNGQITFVRVDSDTTDNLVQKDEEKESVLSDEEQTKIKGLFEAVKGEGEALSTVFIKPLSPQAPPVQITKPEFMRRMKEMQQMQGMGLGDMPESFNIVVNSNHPLVADKLMNATDNKDELTKYLYNLALLNHGMLKGNQLSEFIEKSYEFL